MPRLNPLPATLSMRPPRTADEMLGVLRTRFDVYSATSGLCNLQSLEMQSRLDLCPFDSHSHHLAMLLDADEQVRVVGGMRIVMDTPSPQAGLLKSVVAHHPALRARLNEPRSSALPMLSYLMQAPAVLAEHQRCQGAGLRVAEASRLAVRTQARRLAASQGFAAGEFMVASAAAYAFLVVGLDRVLVDCTPQLAGLYHRYGFAPVPGAEAVHQPSMQIELLALSSSLDSIPAATRLLIESMAAQFKRDGVVRSPKDAGSCAAMVAA